jgi:MFS family permease
MRLAAILLVGAIAALLDTTIVNVAIRTIGRDLHAPLGVVQWVMTGYLLSYAMVIPLSGWALARFGGRATWLTALGVFLAASVAAGAAWNIGSLIAFRVVQGIGGGLLASFIAWALGPMLGRHRRVTPLVDLRLFRVRSFTGAASLMFISGLSMYGALLVLPLYYQQVRGASALGAGLLMAPQGIGALLPRTLAGKLTDRIGPRPVVLAGMVVAAAGTVPFALAGTHTSELLLSLVLVVRGAGLTTANIALLAGAFEGLPRASVPDASSVTRIMQQIGGSFGTAVLAVILVGHSFHATFWWSVAFTALAVLPALMLPRRAAGSGTAAG